jgi:Tfp pilus assembly protein PilF
MKTLAIYMSVLAGLLCAPIAAAKDIAPSPNIFETLEVRPLTRSSSDVYDVLTQLINAREDYATGHYDRSYRAFKYVALHDRNNVEAALGTANSALEIGRAAEALVIFKNLSAATLKAEDSLAVQSGLAIAETLTLETESSENRLTAALELAPQDARLWNALGRVYQSQEQWQDAALAFEHAHEEGYSRAGLYNNFGLLLIAQNRPKTALRYFAHAAKMESSSPAYENNYRTALLMNGQYERAMEDMTDMRAAALLTRSGHIAIKNKNPALARLLLTQAAEISPVYNAQAQAGLEKLAKIDK